MGRSGIGGTSSGGWRQGSLRFVVEDDELSDDIGKLRVVLD